MSGDVQIVARIDSVTMADQWSKSGVMIRASLSASSAHAFTLVSAAKGLAFQRRQQNGGDSLNTAGAASTAPYWVRLTRVGTQVTAAVSANGTTWTTLGTDTIALGTTAYVGIATTSHNSTNTTSADVSQVSVTAGGSGGGGGTPPPGGLPAGQTDADIGNPSLKGSATYSTGVYTVSGSGADIWGTSDQFNYVYQPANGDVDVSARVSSITNTDGWTKAGVMIRETLTAGSRHASAFLTPGQGYAFQDRALTNGTSANTSTTGAAPGWVRIKRTGNLFTAYKSSDGRTWTVIASDSISMADAIYVGIALTSHNSAATAKATVDNFSVTAGQSNQPPAVSLTAPASGATYTAPASISLTASASDPEGQLSKVEFYQGTTLLGTDTTSPYSFTWSSVGAGTYSLTAVAYDAAGAKTTSSAVSVTVSGTTNKPPTVSLTSPTSGASFTAPATISLTASASDPEGKMSKVEFYSGSTLLGTDTTSPYTFGWTSVAAGTYSLTAVAYDTAGAKTTSSAVSVTVTGTNQPPTVSLTSPSGGASFTAPATISLTASASDPEGKMSKVEFYAGAILLGTDTSSPYSFSWPSVAAGTYSLTAVAYDTAGAKTTSSAVSVTVSAVTAPLRYVVFQASADHATLVTSYRLSVYASGANPATATPISTANLGKPTPAANNDITVDELSFFNALAPGNYIATVSAIGSGGTSQSAAIPFTR